MNCLAAVMIEQFPFAIWSQQQFRACRPPHTQHQDCQKYVIVCCLLYTQQESGLQHVWVLSNSSGWTGQGAA
jgi:hypothetical protein